MHSYYKLKFERDAKDKPSHWFILPDRAGVNRLVHLPPFVRTK